MSISVINERLFRVQDEELSKPPKAKKSMKAPIIDDDE